MKNITANLSRTPAMGATLRNMLALPLIMLTVAMLAPAEVQADEPFIGEVRQFAGNFAPRGYVFCDGQLLPIAQNTALFSILGTTFGGDGRTTFGVPDLRGRTPLGPRRGPGLTDRRLGEKVGVEQVTLTEAQLPAHNHPLNAADLNATDTAPASNLPAMPPGLLGTRIYADGPPNTLMNTAAITDPGNGAEPHNNMQPFLGLNYIIAVQGLFPSRN